MKKIENAEDACRALAEKYPEKYRSNEYGFSYNTRAKGGIFESSKLVDNYIDFDDLCACDFDSILELEGLEYEVSRRRMYSSWDFYLHKIGRLEFVYHNNDGIGWGTKQLASEAAFIAAVELGNN